MPLERISAELSQLVDGSMSAEEFFASLVHETAQPLAAVLTLCTGLRAMDADLTPIERRKFVDDIEDQVRYLQELLRSIASPFTRERARADRLLDAIAERCRPIAPDHRVKLRHNVGDTEVEIDCVRFEAAIRNLVKNAMQHSRPGGTIAVTATADDDTLRVSVSDEGDQGIPEHEWSRVFEPYVRLPGPGERFAGQGLGLHLVQRFATAHGGAAEIERSGPSGTTVSLELPLAPT